MRTKKLLVILFPLSIIAIREANAQGTKIQGDTIFVNSDVEVEIKFPSPDVEGRWVDRNPPYVLSLTPTSIFIHAKVDNVPCSRLVVNEGKRDHSFVVCYKKNINQDVLKEVQYDYSTLKKIQQRVKEIEVRDAAKASLASAPMPAEKNLKEPPPPSTKTTTAANTSSIANTSGSYYALLEAGDQAMKDGDFDKAQGKYEEVLRINPGNNFAKKGLSDVGEKRAAKAKAVQQEQEAKINTLRTNAGKAYAAKNYDEALKGYNDVLALNPNDATSKAQIKVIDKYKADLAEKERLDNERLVKKQAEDKINNLKLAGIKALNEKRYDEAILTYQEVLALAPNDELSKGRIVAIQKIKEQNELKVKQEAANKDRDENYKAIINAADKAFESKEFDVAKAGYLSAKDIKPNDAALAIKLKLTEEKILSKENEDEYSTAITLGDAAKKAGDYDKAKAEFTKASKVFKDRKYPQDQLAEINTIITNTTAKLNSAKEKETRELASSVKYQAAIEKADKAFQKDDFTNAKISYAEAATIKPDEVYPKEKLTEIATVIESRDKEKKIKADSIARFGELNKNYTIALQKGKAAFDKGDLQAARKSYTAALELKPNEFEPKSQLELIDKKISQTGSNVKFDSAMAKGNLAAADKDLNTALESYREALKMKPLDNTALAQVQYMQRLIAQEAAQQAEATRRAEVRVQEEIRIAKFNEGMKAWGDYENAAQTANFEDQLIYLKKFLNIIPDATEFNNYQANSDKKIPFAKTKINTIREYLTRVKGAAFQLEAIPYLNQELEKKFENINVSAPPDDQIIIRDTIAFNESAQLSKSILSEKPRLTLDDSSNYVKVTCQNITFKGDKAYYKFLIKNSDKTEFLTGQMQLSLVKKDGTVTKSNPHFVSAFPIILPGKEFVVLYAAKELEVKNNDTLLFELSDRLKQNKLKISIPGSVYNKEKNPDSK
jgi:tetratricopeptide (TPR) repeat protein